MSTRQAFRRDLGRFWTRIDIGGKTPWDWIRLLIVLIGLAGAAFWISSEQRETELEIEKYRQQEAALREYRDSMTDLVLNQGLRTSEDGAAVRTVAQARTLTVVQGLDGNRKGQLLKFLFELGVIRGQAIISLDGADLREADLRDADLSLADLSRADLRDADLRDAELSRADVTDEQLASAASLKGAIMPNGTQHE